MTEVSNSEGLLQPEVIKLNQDFYPLETGPLLSVYPYLKDGLWLYLPDDREKISQIHGKFIVRPIQEKTEEEIL